MTPSFWAGRRVFVTGHTGFKGAWLALALADLGAEVHGFALPAEAPALFTVARVAATIATHTVGDIRDAAALATAMAASDPEIVFHLAAQSLVRTSYAEPVATYAVNVLGTAHVLEAVRGAAGVRAVVVVTSDKCYDHRGDRPFREGDPLGGADPYSSSKACAELVAAAYRASFLDAAGVEVATVRAGNVIGGGDTAVDRLLPDVLRSLDAGGEVVIRHPAAVRPWQHVLDPLLGYLTLAERLAGDRAFADAWNFGPAAAHERPVAWILDYIAAREPALRWRIDDGAHVAEAATLRLDSARARDRLGWVPHWDLPAALDRTLEWHRAWRDGEDVAALCRRQIAVHGGFM